MCLASNQKEENEFKKTCKRQNALLASFKRPDCFELCESLPSIIPDSVPSQPQPIKVGKQLHGLSQKI